MQLFGELGHWFGQQPQVSKWLLIFSVLIPICMQFGLVSPLILYYDVNKIVYKLQIWRVLTSLFLAKPSISFVFNCFFRFQYSCQLEFGSGKFLYPGEYLYFLLLTGLALNVPDHNWKFNTKILNK